MKYLVYFLSGLGSLVGGLIVFLSFQRIRAWQEYRDIAEHPFTDVMAALGFLIMIGGPVFFWLLLPVIAGAKAVISRLSGAR